MDLAPQLAIDEETVCAGDDVLRTDAFRFTPTRGTRILDRSEKLLNWSRGRIRHGVWPYFRTFHTGLTPRATVAGEDGRVTTGLNFGAQDYLSLSTHPQVRTAAERALREYGPITAGSLALNGGMPIGAELGDLIADTLDFTHTLLFPTGWAAGYGTIHALVNKHDHVVLDELAHNSLRQGATASTTNIRYFTHLDSSSVRAHLTRIRATDPKNQILVVTEGIFSMDSDALDIRELIGICREFDAVLLVDIAHDFGALGPGGTGQLGVQDVLHEVDLVVGAFSKSFATTGGFLVTRSAAVREYVRLFGGPQTFSSALTPVQLAVALESLRIIRTAEGDQRRAAVAAVATRLRAGLRELGHRPIGNVVSPVVPVLVGDTPTARIAWRLANEHGVIANLAEPPGVPSGQARFRLQAMADHTESDADEVVRVLDNAIRTAEAALGRS